VPGDFTYKLFLSEKIDSVGMSALYSEEVEGMGREGPS